VSLEDVLRARDMLSRALLGDEGRRFGVWGVGVSRVKYVGGRAVEMPGYGVVVFVRKKLPADQVPPNLLVPRAVNVGGRDIWTDVVEGPMPSILAFDLWIARYGYKPRAGAAMAGECTCNTSRCRPIEPGLSVADCEATACTSTGAFTDGSKIYWLTNAHCFKAIRTCREEDLIYRPVSQPGPYDGGRCPEDVIGTSVRASNIFKEGYTDTALIDIGNTPYTSTLHGTAISFNGKYRTPDTGEDMIKSGRTTGVRIGKVVSIHTDVYVDYGCVHRLVRDTIVTQPILEPGDSGSPAVLRDGTFAGQGFAGSPFASIFIDPQNIYREFGVTPVPGAKSNKINIYIEASTAKDQYARYVGMWVDRDPGPDFWQKEYVGIAYPPRSLLIASIDPPQPGKHSLYVRVSTTTPWTIHIYGDLGDLGTKETVEGLAVFEFTYGQRRTPAKTTTKAIVRVAQPGEEVTLRTDREIYEALPGQTIEATVYANYKSDNAPVDGYRVEAELAGEKTSACLSNGQTKIGIKAPETPGEYELVVTLYPEQCVT